MPVIALAELAIKKGLIRQDPFEDYEISMEETDRSYLLKEDVEKLMLLKPSKSKYELVKDLFIFSCFTGLSYIDIQKLKWSNIQSFFDGHGPPMRVGTKSEIVMLNLKPQNRK